MRGDVGLIAVDRAGAVHQHDLAALHALRLVAAVRVGRSLSQQDQAAVVAAAEPLLGRGDQRVDVGRRHALARALAGVAQRGEHDVVRRLHQREARAPT